MPRKEYLECAKVATAHGVCGVLQVECWCDAPTLEGIESREAAVALRGQVLYAARADIPVPEGGALIADMIGLSVMDADTGRVYGVLHDVTPAPAADLYDIKTPSGAHVLLPAVPAFLDRIDLDNGIYIRPIPGFFEEE